MKNITTKNDFEINNFAVLNGLMGKQFNKNVYSSIIKFKDLNDFLQVFPEVQREIIPKKIKSIKKYIISGLGMKNPMRFFSAITVSCRGQILYDDSTNRIAIDTFNSKLSINDGQHRIEAIKSLLRELEDSFIKSKDKEETTKIKNMINELNEMTLPLVIFAGLKEKEEKQLFFDLNNLAQRSSRNTSIKLNQTDLYSKLAREISEENRYLLHYGVEKEKMSIHPKNSNTILLTTIYACIKELLSRSESLTINNYENQRKYLIEIFDKIFYNLPPDINIKNKYIIDKSYTLKAICRFIIESQDLYGEDTIYNSIKDLDWSHNIYFWRNYDAAESISGNLIFAGGSSGGFRAVYKALNKNI